MTCRRDEQASEAIGIWRPDTGSVVTSARVFEFHEHNIKILLSKLVELSHLRSTKGKK
jgi:hypothetical protein